MKKLILLLGLATTFYNGLKAQIIPFGTSMDSVATVDGYNEPVYYYKPLTYDSLTSPMILAFHGQGGNGMSEIVDLIDIAERRHALIVAPNLIAGYGFTKVDTIENDTIVYWAPEIYKVIYRHVLGREQRDTIWVHMIGFSAGGQTVTRYMLIRQAFPDSIPIRMAVSSNPQFYAFCTDFYNGSCMAWPCGLGIPDLSPTVLPLSVYDVYFICNEHVIQYYNENYAVLIGTGDTLPQGQGAGGCPCNEGANRYESAFNFYNFSLNDAAVRGTTFQWEYQEIAGVPHYQPPMYNTKASTTDSSTIAETLLFDTPYHNVPSLVTVASFYADSTMININGTVNFINNSINATSYLWDFGDGTTSTLANPSHVYLSADSFTVKLTAYNAATCGSESKKRHYIIVKNPTSVNEINLNNAQIKVYPNPASNSLVVKSNLLKGTSYTLTVTDMIGTVVYKEQGKLQLPYFTKDLDCSGFSKGMYIISLTTNKELLSERFGKM